MNNSFLKLTISTFLFCTLITSQVFAQKKPIPNTQTVKIETESGPIDIEITKTPIKKLYKYSPSVINDRKPGKQPSTGKVADKITEFSGSAFNKTTQFVFKTFPIEASGFYAGMFLQTLRKVHATAMWEHDDPSGIISFIEHLESPIGQVSFANFMIANRIVAAPLKQWAQQALKTYHSEHMKAQKLLAKNLNSGFITSHNDAKMLLNDKNYLKSIKDPEIRRLMKKSKKFLGLGKLLQKITGPIGMAAGMIASSVTEEVWHEWHGGNMDTCSTLSVKPEKTQEEKINMMRACDDAYNTWTISNKGWQWAPHVVSLIAAAGLNTLFISKLAKPLATKVAPKILLKHLSIALGKKVPVVMWVMSAQQAYFFLEASAILEKPTHIWSRRRSAKSIVELTNKIQKQVLIEQKNNWINDEAKNNSDYCVNGKASNSYNFVTATCADSTNNLLGQLKKLRLENQAYRELINQPTMMAHQSWMQYLETYIKTVTTTQNFYETMAGIIADAKKNNSVEETFNPETPYYGINLQIDFEHDPDFADDYRKLDELNSLELIKLYEKKIIKSRDHINYFLAPFYGIKTTTPESLFKSKADAQLEKVNKPGFDYKTINHLIESAPPKLSPKDKLKYGNLITLLWQIRTLFSVIDSNQTVDKTGVVNQQFALNQTPEKYFALRYPTVEKGLLLLRDSLTANRQSFISSFDKSSFDEHLQKEKQHHEELNNQLKVFRGDGTIFRDYKKLSNIQLFKQNILYFIYKQLGNPKHLSGAKGFMQMITDSHIFDQSLSEDDPFISAHPLHIENIETSNWPNYLLTSMVCGPDVASFEQIDNSTNSSRLLEHAKFYKPGSRKESFEQALKDKDFDTVNELITKNVVLFEKDWGYNVKFRPPNMLYDYPALKKLCKESSINIEKSKQLYSSSRNIFDAFTDNTKVYDLYETEWNMKNGLTKKPFKSLLEVLVTYFDTTRLNDDSSGKKSISNWWESKLAPILSGQMGYYSKKYNHFMNDVFKVSLENDKSYTKNDSSMPYSLRGSVIKELHFLEGILKQFAYEDVPNEQKAEAKKLLEAEIESFINKIDELISITVDTVETPDYEIRLSDHFQSEYKKSLKHLHNISAYFDYRLTNSKRRFTPLQGMKFRIGEDANFSSEPSQISDSLVKTNNPEEMSYRQKIASNIVYRFFEISNEVFQYQSFANSVGQ